MPSPSDARSTRNSGAGRLDDTVAWSGLPDEGDRSTARSRPRPTARMAVLVLVVAALAVSFASSFHAYLVQRDHVQSTKAQIAEREAGITALEREKQRWEDPAYVQAQATRLGYVKIGEVGFLVLDEDGEPLQHEGELSDPGDILEQKPTPWWTKAWASMEAAGDPPTEAEQHRSDKIIDGTKQ